MVHTDGYLYRRTNLEADKNGDKTGGEWGHKQHSCRCRRLPEEEGSIEDSSKLKYLQAVCDTRIERIAGCVSSLRMQVGDFRYN